MDKAFRNRLLLGYGTDPYWRKITIIINNNVKYITNGEGAELSFIRDTIDRDLILHKNKFIGLERLYIP